MTTQDSIRRAKAHISQIRQGKGLDSAAGTLGIVADLEQALKTIAEQLYQKSTHFLLELIQNADDNSYETKPPELRLTYRKGYIRIDCNETGFGIRNIEAICRVGHSTKAGADAATRYVGEKGIGFKSVFKVADVVWIHSKSYSFKFDKSAQLGMIAPIWADFPEKMLPNYTSMLMQLSPTYKQKELVDELRSLDPRMMIFLRKLKEIHIKIHHDDGSMWTSKLGRTQGQFHGQGAGEAAIQLCQDDKKMQYIVTTFRASDLPKDPKRPGVSTSEVLLAFPYGCDDGQRQQVYAILPIRDYGFEADFLLIASREDIDVSSEWNQALRDNFVQAFVRAIKSFHGGRLQYVWPRYLPTKPSGSPFFEKAKSQILDQLTKERVLQSRNGQLIESKKLVYVPEEFRDADDNPLTISPENEYRYLSAKYSSDDSDQFSSLGVTELSEEDFIADLAEYIIKHKDAFRRHKSTDWHGRIAQILTALLAKPEYKARISQLELIPLSGQQFWVSIRGRTLFLPAIDREYMVPGGIDVCFVDEEAANDPRRRELFTLLGVQPFSPIQVCIQIVGTHMDAAVSPSSFSREQLISQAVFLYNLKWINPTKTELWLVSHDERRIRGKDLYLDSELPLSATAFFHSKRREFPFLHPDYLTAVPEATENWLRWLSEYLHLSTLPRLVYESGTSPETRGFTLADDFIFVIRHRRSSEFLQLLRDNWKHYSQWIDEDENEPKDSMMNLCREKLRKTLGATRVRTLEGPMLPLAQTCLPVETLVSEAGGCVQFLDVPEPDDARWSRLKRLGVCVKLDAQFYVNCLKNLSGDEVSPMKAASFLEQIQARYSDAEDLIRTSFSQLDLIYVPPKTMGEASRWVKPEDCLWQGPKCFRWIVPLKDIYPSNKRLFNEILKIPNCGNADLVREAMWFTMGDPVQSMRDLFLEMEKALQEDESETAFKALRTATIYPISTFGCQYRYDILKRGDVGTKDWFIADRDHLEQSFNGKIPILAFSVEDIGRMPRLLRTLGMEQRKLTRAAKSIATTRGTVVPDRIYEESLRKKVEFILRLIPDTERRRNRIATQLRSLEVFSAESVVQDWSLELGSVEIRGESSKGNVVLSADESVLRIYLSQRYIALNPNPYEFVRQMASFCSITDNYLLLLNIVLTDNNQDNIGEVFKKEGVPGLRPDAEYESEDDDEDKATDAATHPNNLAGYTEGPPRAESTAPSPGRTPVSVAHGVSTGQPQRVNIVYADSWRAYLSELREKFDANNAHLFPGNGADTPVSYGTGSTAGGPAHRSILNILLPPRNNHGILTPATSEAASDDGRSEISETPSRTSTLSLGGFRLLASRRRQQARVNTAESEVDAPARFTGELFVSRLLERMLANAYVPAEHWTSKSRSGAGYAAWTAPEDDYSTFTFADSSGAFTTSLIAAGHAEAEAWSAVPPRYHLEVKTTTGGLGAEFNLTAAQLNRARSYTISDPSEGPPADVSILIRVFDIDTSPNLNMLMDPWETYLADDLRLTAVAGYRGQVKPE